MKIVNIIGGLGNQMFQYAFAVALQRKYPEERVLIDTQLYSFPLLKTYKGNNFYHNGFEIQQIFPNASVPIASFKEIAEVSYYIPNYILNKAIKRFVHHRKSEFIQSYKEAYVFNSNVFKSNASYFDGYWMSPAYFDFCRNDILKIYAFSDFKSAENKELAFLLKSKNSVTMHIRRGDYVGAENFKDICTLAYYRNAVIEVRKIISNPEFFIFSNDLDWCRKNLKEEFGDSKVVFVTNNKGADSYCDMQLMSLARCNILANSSFSWWGAYLNQRDDHIVFCPEKWVNNLCYDDVYVGDWNKISIL